VIILSEYPKNPVFAVKRDANGRVYETLYFNEESKAVECVGEKNIMFTGKPNITLRTGDSMHGDEIIFCLFSIKEVKKVKRRSKQDSLEIYLPARFIGELEFAVNQFKQRLVEVRGEGGSH